MKTLIRASAWVYLAINGILAAILWLSFIWSIFFSRAVDADSFAMGQVIEAAFGLVWFLFLLPSLYFLVRRIRGIVQNTNRAWSAYAATIILILSFAASVILIKLPYHA